MIHVSGQYKVVGVPANPTITGLWPDAKVIEFAGVPTVLLPHGLPETVMLRNIGLDVPAPILSQYHFPAPKHQPAFRVQKLTAALLSTCQRAYCLNGLGTGKTRSAIWAFDYLRGIGMAQRALVIAPLSTLENVWRKEVFYTANHLKVAVLHGSKQKRLDALYSDADVLVINTDGIKVLGDELFRLFSKGDIDAMIIDELALMRNARSERSKLCRKLASSARWVWGLTGSPTPNEPPDAWGQCRIITPHTVPKHFKAFREETMVKVTAFKFVPKREANDIVFRAMQPAVRFTLDDVTELPSVIERPQDVEMGPRQAHIYEEIRKHGYLALKDGTIDTANGAAVLNKLLQISLGYVYTQDRNVVALDNDKRLEALSDAVAGTDRKVLVFVPYIHALEGVFHRMSADGVETAVVSGDTPRKERDRIFGLFQNTDKFKVIAAHPGCMAHGLTLTAADTIVWFGPTTSNETFEQANARIRRVGQLHKQLILMLQATPAEKKMWQRLQHKQSVQSNLLDLFAEASMS
jgi:SNF2 family DNA or RNA helicase